MGYITVKYNELSVNDNSRNHCETLDILHNTLIGDLNKLKNDILTKADKIELSTKYGINSYKVADIKDAIYNELKHFRCIKTSLYNPRDFYDFYAHTSLATYKKCEEAFDGETIEFVLFVEKMLQHKIETNTNICFLKNAIREHNNVQRYIKEHSSSHKNDVDCIQKIYYIINDLIVDYKNSVLKIVEEIASKYYVSAELKMPKLEKIIIDANTTGIKQNNYYNIWKEYSHYKYIILKNTKDKYVKQQIDLAYKQLNAKIMNLAKRLVDGDFNINIENLKISNVSSDPKLFDMIIEDGVIKLHARSIFAAEYSEKVTPHFRFIITSFK